MGPSASSDGSVRRDRGTAPSLDCYGPINQLLGGAAEGLGEPLGGGEYGGGVHLARLPGEPLERAGDRDRRDDLAARGADRRRDRGDAGLALADRLRPAAPADARQ